MFNALRLFDIERLRNIFIYLLYLLTVKIRPAYGRLWIGVQSIRSKLSSQPSLMSLPLPAFPPDKIIRQFNQFRLNAGDKLLFCCFLEASSYKLHNGMNR